MASLVEVFGSAYKAATGETFMETATRLIDEALDPVGRVEHNWERVQVDFPLRRYHRCSYCGITREPDFVENEGFSLPKYGCKRSTLPLPASVPTDNLPVV